MWLCERRGEERREQESRRGGEERTGQERRRAVELDFLADLVCSSLSLCLTSFFPSPVKSQRTRDLTLSPVTWRQQTVRHEQVPDWFTGDSLAPSPLPSALAWLPQAPLTTSPHRLRLQDRPPGLDQTWKPWSGPGPDLETLVWTQKAGSRPSEAPSPQLPSGQAQEGQR